jgi:AraC family transcriptional regulator, activator of mtrCDE
MIFAIYAVLCIMLKSLKGLTMADSVESIDWLSRLLELVPVSGRVEHRCTFGAPWRLDQGPVAVGEIPYHVVLAGSATLEGFKESPPRRLHAGDILLFPHGDGHRLHDGSGAEPAAVSQRHGATFTINENVGTGERLDMLCGRFMLSQTHARLIGSYFPEVLVANTALGALRQRPTMAGEQLMRLVGLMRYETLEEHLGARAMLTGLSTALFALTLRFAAEAAQAPAGLLALAAHARLAPATAALFNRPSHPWTLPELAALCNMSRATFVRQFQRSVGRSAAELLGDIRMMAAANELRLTDRSIGAVAGTAGYQSEAAFQRAFKQRMGITPAQYRRTVQLMR